MNERTKAQTDLNSISGEGLFRLSLGELIPRVITAVKENFDQEKNVALYRFGFYRVPFYQDRNQDGLALHIWLQDLPREELPHSHVFHLRSRVLLGSITNHIWLPHEDDLGDFQPTRVEY